MLVFSAGYLFANGGSESDTKPKVDRNSWKQSKTNIKYNDGPSGVSISVRLNDTAIQYLQPGQSISLNCPEGPNYLIVASERIDFNSELNITSIEFDIVPEPMKSKITLSFKDGKKSSTVNVLLNGILNSTIGFGQTIEIDVPDGNNLLEIQSRKYKEAINILSNSNNTFVEFNTSKILAKIENVNLVKTEQLTMYTVQNLDIDNTEIVVMPDELRKQIEEEDRQNELLKQRLNNLIYKPENFTSEDIKKYRNGDLFDAVVVSEKLHTNNFTLGYNLYGIFYNPFEDFVSDVVFIRQDINNITFRNLGGDVTKTMKVNTRLGLNQGQRVRIYYRVYNDTAWEIKAIEKL
jgi:hypothetical protein